jgi:predicted DNA-binding transcriptional regulator AlpA
MTPELPPVLRPDEAASFLTLSKQRLAKYRTQGGGPKFLKLGRSVAYLREDLEAWLHANSRRSTSDLGAR